jgi:hypothetical protein
MSSDQPRRRESGGSPGSPMGSTAAIVIAIVAVVAGFLILRSIGKDDNNGGAITNTTLPTQTTPLPSSETVAPITDPPTTVTTIFTPTVEGATALVANASTVNGAAGQLTTALSGKGFTMSKAGNATVKQDASTVLYLASDPEALNVANSIATLMGGIAVSEMPTPAPLAGGVVPDGVSIIVMLGNDKANQTLDAMGTPGTTTTTVAGTGTAGTTPTT